METSTATDRNTSHNTSPVERLIGVVGCGYWGKHLVRNFEALNALFAVCEPSQVGCDLAEQLAPHAAVVKNYQALLEADDVQGVVIATPAETHFKLAKQALACGKDVFVEKPLALTSDEGEQLVTLANDNQQILMVGHVLEYHPAIIELLRLARDDHLGKIHYIYSNRLSLGKVRREENILWSFAPHDVAVILRLMDDMPYQVTACGGSYLQPNIADVTVTNLLFNNGVRAHIHVSWLHPFKEQRLVVIGQKRMASYDDVNRQLVVYDQRVEFKDGNPISVTGPGVDIDFSPQEPLRIECEAFLHAIQTRRNPITDGISGLRVLSVLQAAQRSLVMHGEPVTFSKHSF